MLGLWFHITTLFQKKAGPLISHHNLFPRESWVFDFTSEPLSKRKLGLWFHITTSFQEKVGPMISHQNPFSKRKLGLWFPIRTLFQKKAGPVSHFTELFRNFCGVFWAICCDFVTMWRMRKNWPSYVCCTCWVFRSESCPSRVLHVVGPELQVHPIGSRFENESARFDPIRSAVLVEDRAGRRVAIVHGQILRLTRRVQVNAETGDIQHHLFKAEKQSDERKNTKSMLKQTVVYTNKIKRIQSTQMIRKTLIE